MFEENFEGGIKNTPQRPVYGAGNKLVKYCYRCGSDISTEKNFCKSCGANLEYLHNELNSYKPPAIYNKSNYKKRKTAPKVYDNSIIVKGGLLAFGLSFLLGFVLGFFLFNASIDTILIATSLASMLSFFIGALYAGYKSSEHHADHGIGAALVCVGLSIPLNLLFGMPFDLSSIFGAIFWGVLIGSIGGFIGSKISKTNSKIKQIPVGQTSYM